MTILLIGGSGSGKSALAEKIIAASACKKRYYIATMRLLDEESHRRAARHRAQRAALNFETVEAPMNLSSLRLPPGAAVLLEDIPNLLANEMFGGGDPDGILSGVQALSETCGLLVVVTGNVFSDGLRYGDGTQAYMERLAEINSQIAQMADAAAEVVFSIPVPLKGALPCPPSHP